MKKAHVLKRCTAIALVLGMSLSFASIKSLAAGDNLEKTQGIYTSRHGSQIYRGTLQNDQLAISLDQSNDSIEIPTDIMYVDLIQLFLSRFEEGSKINEITEMKFFGKTITISGEVMLPNGNLIQDRIKVRVPGMPLQIFGRNLIDDFLSQYESGTKVIAIEKLVVDKNTSTIFINGTAKTPDGTIHDGGCSMWMSY